MRSLRLVRHLISACLYAGTVALLFVPATPTERAALGDTPPRFEVIQMRLAHGMTTLAPEFSVWAYATATGAAPEDVRLYLDRKATGTDLFAGPATTQAQPPSTTRRIEAGGALFVRPD